jgi:hypothetical protein
MIQGIRRDEEISAVTSSSWKGTTASLMVVLLGGCGPEPASDSIEPLTAAAVTASAAGRVTGTYFFQLSTTRGPLDGNWQFHPDGTFASVSNGVKRAAGTWTSDGAQISLLEQRPYGNSCRLTAPLTASGFASATAPSTDARCTFNGIKPNPVQSWYAARLR